MHPRHTAIILAAGMGRRMGGPKALMRVRGEPWWRVQRGALAAAGIPALWVTSERVEAELRASGFEGPSATADETAPMLTSLCAAVRSLAAHPPAGVYVLPVDVPVPAPAVWSALGGDRIAVPVHGGRRGHPVYLPWPWVIETLPRAESAGGRLDELICNLAAEVIVDDPRVRMNLNTPEARAAYEAWLMSSERHTA